MCQIAFSIPEEILYDTRQSEEEAPQFVRRSAALSYYVNRGVSGFSIISLSYLYLMSTLSLPYTWYTAGLICPSLPGSWFPMNHPQYKPHHP